MARTVRYQIEITREAEEHLTALTAHERSRVVDSLEPQLTFEPKRETRNRKRMRPNPVAPWELRVGSLRVYFEVEETPKRVVRVLAVGVKDHNVVRIGGEEVELK